MTGVKSNHGSLPAVIIDLDLVRCLFCALANLPRSPEVAFRDVEGVIDVAEARKCHYGMLDWPVDRAASSINALRALFRTIASDVREHLRSSPKAELTVRRGHEVLDSHVSMRSPPWADRL